MSNYSLVRPGLTTAIIGHLPAIKLRLRRKVPQLTFQDVRRARIPFYEALASELYEAGYTNAAFLLLQLIEYEHDHVPSTSDQTIEDKRLKNSKSLLNFLFQSLRETEGYKINQQYDTEVESLLTIGQSFENDKHKHWIARQFFLISLDRCEACCLGEDRVAALANYYYGRFLTANGQLEEALKVLEAAKKLCSTQSWPLEQSKNIRGSQLLISVILEQLFIVYSKLSEKYRKTDLEKFELYMQLSHEVAVDSKLEHVLCDSYLNYGDFLLTKGEHREALNCYKESSKRARIIYSFDKVCKTKIRMAAAHRSLNELKECEHLLQSADKLTEHNRMTECYAEQKLLTGEINFGNGHLAEATKDFQTARAVYQNLAKGDKMILASSFGALASAGIHFGKFVGLVRQTDFHGRLSDNKTLFKLLRWSVDGIALW
ncbi:uncharacterized protein LOC129720726 [Wyeomyia smithii]|uniref:uncharacterized protein LOC129720726 n=1 Tax=Wyeomyia smithii TaxID=174621 RepID=UPI002468016E|nr:uncharacterized protein LOC129720726 [Wyeomyia smithii]